MFLNALTGVSLVVFAAVLSLWVRSLYVADRLGWEYVGRRPAEGRAGHRRGVWCRPARDAGSRPGVRPRAGGVTRPARRPADRRARPQRTPPPANRRRRPPHRRAWLAYASRSSGGEHP